MQCKKAAYFCLMIIVFFTTILYGAPAKYKRINPEELKIDKKPLKAVKIVFQDKFLGYSEMAEIKKKMFSQFKNYIAFNTREAGICYLNKKDLSLLTDVKTLDDIVIYGQVKSWRSKYSGKKYDFFVDKIEREDSLKITLNLDGKDVKLKEGKTYKWKGPYGPHIIISFAKYKKTTKDLEKQNVGKYKRINPQDLQIDKKALRGKKVVFQTKFGAYSRITEFKGSKFDNYLSLLMLEGGVCYLKKKDRYLMEDVNKFDEIIICGQVKLVKSEYTSLKRYYFFIDEIKKVSSEEKFDSEIDPKLKISFSFGKKKYNLEEKKKYKLQCPYTRKNINISFTNEGI